MYRTTKLLMIATEDPDAVHGIEIALSKPELPNPLKQKITRLLTSNPDEESQLNDYIFKTFVHGQANTLLAIRLPVQINKTLAKSSFVKVFIWLIVLLGFSLLTLILSFLFLLDSTPELSDGINTAEIAPKLRGLGVDKLIDEEVDSCSFSDLGEWQGVEGAGNFLWLVRDRVSLLLQM